MAAKNSCRPCLGQDALKVGAIGRAGVKARVRSLAVVEVEIATERGARLADAVVGPQIDLLAFGRPPEPFDEDVVAPSSLAVHADGDAVGLQHAGERRAGELRALVGVEDARLAVPGDRLLA